MLFAQGRPDICFIKHRCPRRATARRGQHTFTAFFPKKHKALILKILCPFEKPIYSKLRGNPHHEVRPDGRVVVPAFALVVQQVVDVEEGPGFGAVIRLPWV